MKGIIALSLLMSMAYTAYANPLGQATENACKHFKHCALKEMAGDQNVTPEMKAMFEGIMANMCDGIEKQFQPATFNNEQKLMKAATACLNAMSKVSCDQLDNTDELPACKEYDRIADQYNP